MKKILIFSLSYYPRFVGGAEVAIKEITDRLVGEYEFHLITNRYDSNLPKVSKEGNVVVHRIGFAKPNPNMADLKKSPLKYNKQLFQLHAAFAAWRLNRHEKFDAAWAMMAHSTAVPVALFSYLCPRVPYVLTLQEGDPIGYIERLMRPLWPLFTRGFTRASIIQPISTFLADWARACGFSGPIELIPNGVDMARFSAPISVGALQKASITLNRQPSDWWLLTTSRLVHKNGIDLVIDALPFLPTNVKFAVLGIGPDDEALRAQAERLGVTDRVAFVGQVEHTELPAFLKVVDVFIRMSRSEGMGNSFIEAMGAGVPVLAPQVGGITDFLFDTKHNPDHPQTGFVMDAHTPEELAAQIDAVRLLAPEEKAQVCATAHAFVSHRYEWNTIATEMHAKVFEPLVQKAAKNV